MIKVKITNQEYDKITRFYPKPDQINYTGRYSNTGQEAYFSADAVTESGRVVLPAGRVAWFDYSRILGNCSKLLIIRE